jgi:hypothetical protein
MVLYNIRFYLLCLPIGDAVGSQLFVVAYHLLNSGGQAGWRGVMRFTKP